MKIVNREAGIIWIFAAAFYEHHVSRNWPETLLLFFITTVTYFAGAVSERTHWEHLLSGGKVINCAYCGTRITKRIIKGTEEVWNDSTGNRNCPQRADDLPHTPTVEEPVS